MKAYLLAPMSIICLSITSFYATAEVHADVQAAMDWQFPKNTCTMPKAKQFSNPKTAQRWYEKAEKNWQKCFSIYKENLLTEQEGLKSVASIGLTGAQAEVIIGHLYQIRSAIIDGENFAKDPYASSGQYVARKKDFLQPVRRY